MKTVKFLNLLSGSILPMLFWVFLMFGFDRPYIVILSLISAALHELGHLGAAKLLSCDTSAPSPKLYGFKIQPRTPLPYKKNIMILAAGPLSNVLLSILLLLLPFKSTYLDSFAYVSLATGLSNLVPVEGYDGYGIAKDLLSFRGRDDLYARLKIISFAFCIFMTFLSLYLLDKTNSGYWLFAIFFMATLKNIQTGLSHSIF